MNRIKIHKALFLVLTCLVILFSCEDDSGIPQPDTQDRIEAIDFGSQTRFQFIYFNKFTLVQPQLFTDGEYQDAGNGLEITNFDNKIEIRFSSGRGVQGRLFVDAIIENDRILRVKREFESGSTFTYNFTYSPNTTRIELVFDADGELGDSQPSLIEYGDYMFNESGNVIEVLKYRNFDSPPTENDLYERSTFTYDSANNNWKDMMLFFFGWQTLPDTRFFSANNILRVEQELTNEDPRTYQFQYLYDESGRTFKAFVQWSPLNPDGLTETFFYEGE